MMMTMLIMVKYWLECDNSVKINSSDKCLNNSVLILWYLLSINWCFLIILQLIKDVSTF